MIRSRSGTLAISNFARGVAGAAAAAATRHVTPVPVQAPPNAVKSTETGLAIANPLWIVPLGRTNYDACHALQRRVFEAKARPIKAARLSQRKRFEGDHLPDVIFVTEHAHSVYTMGRRDTSEGFKDDSLRDAMQAASRDGLTAKHAEEALELLAKPASGKCVRQIQRGGALTWHGPGQAVVYPIVEFRYYWEKHPVAKRGASPLHWITEQLEQAMILTLHDFGLQGHTSKVGVWVPVDGAPNGEAKIGFVGLHAGENVTMHGCSLNVQCDLDGFEPIEMCELPELVPTSVQAEVSKHDNEGAHTKCIGFTEDRVAKVGAMIADHLAQLLVPRSLGATTVRQFQSPKEGLEAVLDTFKI